MNHFRQSLSHGNIFHKPIKRFAPKPFIFIAEDTLYLTSSVTKKREEKYALVGHTHAATLLIKL